MVSDNNSSALLLKALAFAAYKHKDQRRKGKEASPYINHPIEVAEILVNYGVTDTVTLLGAILHDTIEDTQTTLEELEMLFGREIRVLVFELTDDKRLPKHDRKRLQIEHAPNLSQSAKLIKIADKISNVRGVNNHPPVNWSAERCREYLAWTELVVAGCRGCSEALEHLYYEVLKAAKDELAKNIT